MRLKYIAEICLRVLFPRLNRYFYQKISIRKKKYLKQINNTSETNFDVIYKDNFWTNGESLSGNGSSESQTQKIRQALPSIFKKYNIKTLLDAPCGDFHWMRLLDKTSLDYTGCDIVKSVIETNTQKITDTNVRFLHLDITQDDLPEVDLILCRDCFQHIRNEDIIKAIANFKRSKSKYLLVTSYPLTYKNWDIEINGDYRPFNIAKEPLSLHNHLEKIKDGGGGAMDRTLYLFDLKKI